MKLLEKLAAARQAHGVEGGTACVVVSIGEQKLALFRPGFPVEIFVVSTSRAEPSCVKDSLGTPTGLHRVAEKIGGDQPEGMVFKGRKPVMRYQDMPDSATTDNLITSRILWLDGLEEGRNRSGDRDTKSRFVYIHGTNQESKLGTPNSHGCVLLGNADVVRFYDRVPVDALVWIEDDRAEVVG